MSSGASRGKKRHVEHEEHEEHVNHEAWVIPYADMLTLLMALFLVLFAVGRVDTEKFKKLAESFRGEFGGGKSEQVIDLGGAEAGALDGGTGVLDLGAAAVPEAVTAAATEALAEKQQTAAEANATATDLEHVREEVLNKANAVGLGGSLAFRTEARGLVVTIVTDQVVFEAGQAELQVGGVQILDIIAEALQTSSYAVAIEGHTDSRPISTNRYPSNWELSTARATSVLRYLIDSHGFDPFRLSAAGYADTKPLVVGTSPEDQSKNRRVEVVVLSDVDLTTADPLADPLDDPVDVIGEDVATPNIVVDAAPAAAAPSAGD
ncbi:MAG: flagellar motor protein MotB [Acidimicrobiia bacterium]